MRNFMLVMACLWAWPALADSDRQAILDHGHAWSQAYAARDLDRLMALYEPDAWVMLDGQPALKGRDAVRAYFAKAFATPAGSNRIELAAEDVQIIGRLAELISLYRLTVQTDAASAPVVLAGRSLLLYRKGKDGRWRIWRDIDNSTPDATDAAFTKSEAVKP
jgi:uncharacterized protein (TIGR02246 family)